MEDEGLFKLARHLTRLLKWPADWIFSTCAKNIINKDKGVFTLEMK